MWGPICGQFLAEVLIGHGITNGEALLVRRASQEGLISLIKGIICQRVTQIARPFIDKRELGSAMAIPLLTHLVPSAPYG